MSNIPPQPHCPICYDIFKAPKATEEKHYWYHRLEQLASDITAKKNLGGDTPTPVKRDGWLCPGCHTFIYNGEHGTHQLNLNQRRIKE